MYIITNKTFYDTIDKSCSSIGHRLTKLNGRCYSLVPQFAQLSNISIISHNARVAINVTIVFLCMVCALFVSWQNTDIILCPPPIFVYVYLVKVWIVITFRFNILSFVPSKSIYNFDPTYARRTDLYHEYGSCSNGTTIRLHQYLNHGWSLEHLLWWSHNMYLHLLVPFCQLCLVKFQSHSLFDEIFPLLTLLASLYVSSHCTIEDDFYHLSLCLLTEDRDPNVVRNFDWQYCGLPRSLVTWSMYRMRKMLR